MWHQSLFGDEKYWKYFPVYDRVQITYTESIQIHLFKKKELFWNTTERAVQKKRWNDTLVPFKATFECDIDTLESSRDTLERELTCARKDSKETSRSNVALRSVLSKEKSTMKILKSYQEKQTFRTASAMLRGQKISLIIAEISFFHW